MNITTFGAKIYTKLIVECTFPHFCKYPVNQIIFKLKRIFLFNK